MPAISISRKECWCLQQSMQQLRVSSPLLGVELGAGSTIEAVGKEQNFLLQTTSPSWLLMVQRQVRAKSIQSYVQGMVSTNVTILRQSIPDSVTGILFYVVFDPRAAKSAGSITCIRTGADRQTCSTPCPY